MRVWRAGWADDVSRFAFVVRWRGGGFGGGSSMERDVMRGVVGCRGEVIHDMVAGSVGTGWEDGGDE